MARVAIGWGVRDLAAAAGVSTDTIARLERGEELKETTIAAIRAALEAAGVIFVAENGKGPGGASEEELYEREDLDCCLKYRGADGTDCTRRLLCRRHHSARLESRKTDCYLDYCSAFRLCELRKRI